MAFAGFDCSGFPGETVMQKLRSTTNFKFCGYYLAPAPSHSDPSWMGKRSFLKIWDLALHHFTLASRLQGLGAATPLQRRGARTEGMPLG